MVFFNYKRRHLANSNFPPNNFNYMKSISTILSSLKNSFALCQKCIINNVSHGQEWFMYNLYSFQCKKNPRFVKRAHEAWYMH